ncbi:hypothetical protein BDQ17DRAFT_1326039 [Cyathus striatus]|nr:hypothetical protein BDQ17DRAFT_1326039 [Cyathus striatus]
MTFNGVGNYAREGATVNAGAQTAGKSYVDTNLVVRLAFEGVSISAELGRCQELQETVKPGSNWGQYHVRYCPNRLGKIGLLGHLQHGRVICIMFRVWKEMLTLKQMSVIIIVDERLKLTTDMVWELVSRFRFLLFLQLLTANCTTTAYATRYYSLDQHRAIQIPWSLSEVHKQQYMDINVPRNAQDINFSRL